MKTYLLLLASLFLMVACENNQNQNKEIKTENIENPINGIVFGNQIADENIIDASNLSSILENENEKELKLIGTINAVCQMSGCWADIDLNDGKSIHVTFKNESFTIPKDSKGKTAVIEGIATKEIISVDMLKKMAKDEGKSEEVINAISQPETEYNFEAKGLTIK